MVSCKKDSFPPHNSIGRFESLRGEILGHTHQWHPIHFQYLVIHLDSKQLNVW